MNGRMAKTIRAAHRLASERVGQKETVAVFTAKRSIVATPASRTGVSARRAAGLEEFQRRTSVTTTASRTATARTSKILAETVEARSLSLTVKALSGHSSHVVAGLGSKRRPGTFPSTVSTYAAATTARSQPD
jgi:hypothetical protein